MNLQYTFHRAHLERLARIEGAAYRPALVPPVAVAPESVTVVEDLKPRRMWFEILSERIIDREPRIAEIQDAVCKYFKVSKALLLSSRRDNSLVIPRHIGMYLARELTSKSFPEIGRRFHRDHTVPIYAGRKIAGLILSDPCIAYDVGHIAAVLGECG